ncbi:MAG: hypothetical protein JKY08_03345 [Flavobacteriaceae bacterium]|nr:hypothetical protein [Flavobacteriaceae bacterium]
MNTEPINLLSIDGKRISCFTKIKLEQKTNDHHQFEIILDNDVIELIGGHTIDKSKDWLGKSLIITFGNTEFLGYITSVNLENKDGHNGNLIINGYSPTILLEGGSYICSWVNRTLEAIVNQTLETLNIGTEVNPVFKEAIEYQVQYNENNYQFLQRLAKQYNEWFYYNGIQLFFGKPKRGEVIRIEYGRDISEIRMEIKVKDHRQTKYSYNARMNSLVTASSKDQVEGLNELGSHAFFTSAEIYKTKKNSFSNIDSKMKSQIDDLVERKQATLSAGLHVMKARSNKQGLTVGTIIKVTSAITAGKTTFNIQNYGEYMITSITHEATERSEYFNTFEAIPSGISIPEEPKITLPKAEDQIATVISNTDPKRIGRVQVRFDWQTGIMKTSWLRVMTPDAGSSKQHSKNRGHVFIPEVDDQVMVGFEYNDPNRPFVMGGMFHGDNGAGGSANNNIKTIITKSGNELIFNDGDGKGSIKINAPKGNSVHLNGDGSISVFDASGNKMYMDNVGNIDVTAPNHITFNSKKVTFNVMDKMQLNILQKMFIRTPFLKQFISTYYHTQSGKALFTSENEIKIESPELYAVGQNKLYLHSDELATLNSKGVVETKGDKGNKQSNVAEKYEIALDEISAKCIALFRPNAAYKGEFGFDWLRMGDTGYGGDTWYAKIIGEYEGLWNINKQIYAGGVFNAKDWAYKNLMNEFRVMSIPWRKDFYVIPLATIYPNKSAEFTINLEIIEAPTEIIYKYETEFFSLSKPTITTLAKGKHILSDELKVTCIKEFDTTQNIDIIAKDENKTAHLIGRLKMQANNKPNRYVANIVFVNVITDINSTGVIAGVPGISTTDIINQEKYLTPFLQQALITPNIVNEPLNLFDATKSEVKILKSNYTFGTIGSKIFNPYPIKGDGFATFLEKQFDAVTANSIYKDYHKVFFLGESGGYTTSDGTIQGLGGHANGIVSKECVMYANPDNFFVAHELMHCMGLYHTFDNDGKYTFKKGLTENIMDYSHLATPKITQISIWKWQADVLKKQNTLEP